MTVLSPVACIAEHKVNAGMPLLVEAANERAISPFEFLPSWFCYAPVVVQSVLLGLYYRDLRLPLVANPTIYLSGMVGESKHDILSLAGDQARRWISPFITCTVNDLPLTEQVKAIEQRLHDADLRFPLVAKPDLGCRGVGVKLIQSQEQLSEYLRRFPVQARFLLQQKAPYSAEAGIFYVRFPGDAQGQIISMTLKYAPSVMGDGVRTLRELIHACPRSGQLAHLYLPRHPDKLDWVVPDKQEFQLAFAGSHSRGSIFRNGNRYITPALVEKLDAIFDDFPGFHYGRLDVKFSHIDALMRGDAFTILEVNGASSEATHIWDRETRLGEIFTTLLKQYRILYAIGAEQKKRGHKPPNLRALLRAWRKEKQLIQHYPETD
ncbi:D-alanine--D-alanine ligase [Vibrio cholerae]|uniref:D-alanine--D-alanine ligase n=1 Tax=Vibrio cholerae TaxID=666 RepID=UPI001E44B0D7|nr:D-alanine--D-alanine ligase [Vibrio cholerae]MCD6658161.1 D-alanine--D-alanine ligase [Vibrio cholerae]HDI3196182.1 D-alanine--D-alanine ligase [Vibrio cholerae]